MRGALVLACSLGAAALAAAWVGGAAGATGGVYPMATSNWSGYAIADATTVQNGTTDPAQTAPLAFTSITATWRQPKVACSGGGSTYASFWVGLGGFGSTSQQLEQTGTEGDCRADGTAAYYAWYELVPAAPVQLRLRIAAGDLVTASVNVDGSDVLVQVKNRTRRTSFTKHLTMVQPDLTSAEWIAEAPSNCDGYGGNCSVLPLANFGTVTFGRIAAIGSGHPGTIVDPAWAVSQLSLVPGGGGRSFFSNTPIRASGAGAVAAAPSSDGRQFAVSWRSHGAGT